MFLFVYVLAFLVLVAAWLMGDMQIITKVVFTLLYFASWIITIWSPEAVVAVQAVLTIILGIMTFGADAFGGRRR